MYIPWPVFPTETKKLTTLLNNVLVYRPYDKFLNNWCVRNLKIKYLIMIFNSYQL